MTTILSKAWSGWNTMNWLRSFMLFGGLIFSFLALNKLFGKTNEEDTIKVPGNSRSTALQTIKD